MAVRTTLSIDEDVLGAAKAMAERDHKTVGEVISSYARQGMRPAASRERTRNGIPLLPLRPDGGPVTLEMVNKLRDELP